MLTMNVCISQMVFVFFHWAGYTMQVGVFWWYFNGLFVLDARRYRRSVDFSHRRKTVVRTKSGVQMSPVALDTVKQLGDHQRCRSVLSTTLSLHRLAGALGSSILLRLLNWLRYGGFFNVRHLYTGSIITCLLAHNNMPTCPGTIIRCSLGLI